jgi:hypothetical protein
MPDSSCFKLSSFIQTSKDNAIRIIRHDKLASFHPGSVNRIPAIF